MTFASSLRSAFLAALVVLPALLPQIASASSAVEMVYDAAGNLKQFRRQAPSGMYVTGFSPGSGPVGTSVTIFGAGFSAVALDNTVKFNGVAASVAAASIGSLSVTVPSGATSGQVSVTVGAATSYSAGSFVVTVVGAPIVSALAPFAGGEGTVVSVTGANFDPSPGATTVQLSGLTVAATVGSTTSLTFSVPALATSGRVGVSTVVGSGLSTRSFIVTPDGYASGDIIASAHIAPGGAPGLIEVNTPHKHAAITFDALADVFYTIQFSQLSTSPTNLTVNYKVHKPDNTVQATGGVGMSTSRPTIHLPKLAMGGTYTIVLSPGVATLVTNVSIAADPILQIDGPATAIAPPGLWQSARTVFVAAAGQPIGFGLSGFSLLPYHAGTTALRIYLPDGSQLTAGAPLHCYAALLAYSALGNCDGEIVAPQAGTYTMISEVIVATLASYSIQLSNEVVGTLTPDVASAINLARLGQDGRFTFSAAIGDNFAIELFGVTPAGESKTFDFRVIRPNGTQQVAGAAAAPSGAGMVELGTIATSGTYTIVVDPQYAAHGTAHLAAKLGISLATTDSPSAIATSVAGESARFRFVAAAGDKLTIGVESLAYVGTSGSSTQMTIFKPDGTSLASTSCSPATVGGRCKMTLPALTVSGTYSARVTPPAGVRLTGNIALSAELTGSLTASVPASIAVTRPGQNVRYSFAGTTAASTSIELAQLSTTPTNQYVAVTIFKPDGSSMGSSSGTVPGLFINLPSLPTTGTYTVLLDSQNGVPFNGQLTLEPGTALAIDGATGGVSSTVLGEVARFTFPGSAAGRLELGISGLTYAGSSGSTIALSLRGPNGAIIASNSCYSGTSTGCDVAMASLPSTGTYSIILIPPATVTIASGSIALSTPVAGAFSVDGGVQTITIARAGQTARYTFSGTSAQLLRLNWAGTSISGATSVQVTVLKPDGTTLVGNSFGDAATGGLDLPSLPTTGTYTVVIDPSNAGTVVAPLSLVTR